VAPNHVLTRLECRSHRESLNLCVRVDRGVPEKLRCTPSGGLGLGGSSLCRECSDLVVGNRLRDEVNARTRRGWDDHLKAGAVVVGCG
jgi:hypothetical protein